MLSNPKADKWHEMIQTCQFVSELVQNSHQFASGHFSLGDKSRQLLSNIEEDKISFNKEKK